MTTPKNEILTITEFNGETGETIIRPLTAEELAQRQIDLVEFAKHQTAAEAKATARTSALAKLAELGLTQEEIDSL